MPDERQAPCRANTGRGFMVSDSGLCVSRMWSSRTDRSAWERSGWERRTCDSEGTPWISLWNAWEMMAKRGSHAVTTANTGSPVSGSSSATGRDWRGRVRVRIPRRACALSPIAGEDESPTMMLGFRGSPKRVGNTPRGSSSPPHPIFVTPVPSSKISVIVSQSIVAHFAPTHSHSHSTKDHQTPQSEANTKMRGKSAMSAVAVFRVTADSVVCLCSALASCAYVYFGIDPHSPEEPQEQMVKPATRVLRSWPA